MLLLIFFDVTGRLHPAIVHLPIGILLLACLFELLSRTKRYPTIRPAIRIMIFWGMISAVAAVISGLSLSWTGEYEEESIDPHEWSGIATAVTSIILYFLYRYNVKRNIVRIAAGVVFLLVTVTGHLGGSITHGPDYLTEPLAGSVESKVLIKPIPDIQQAVLYTDVVQPLFQARCYNCHGPNKQKGKLRLDQQERIVKGGKSGNTIMAGKPEQSELIDRLLLPLDHEDHMPPKGKPQLTKQQIAILHWWVSSGAGFNKKVSELKQPDQIKPVLLALQTGAAPEQELTEIPEKEIAPADSAVIRKLIAAGVMVLPVARNSNYLSANFVTAGNKADTLLKLLQPLKKQLISLKMDEARLQDSTVSAIAEYTALRRLQLSNTALKDNGLTYLLKLKELRSLNLVGTPVTAKGVSRLRELKELKNLYLYKTSIDTTEQAALKKVFPATNLDFGNYTLPMLATDTTQVKIR